MSLLPSPRSPLICGGHVFRRADQPGETPPGHAGGTARHGDAEIEDFEAAVAADHQVFRLDVAVVDALFMAVIEGLQQAGDHLDALFDGRKIFSVEKGGEVFPLHIIEDEVGGIFLGKINGHNEVRVMQQPADGYFPPEPFIHGGVPELAEPGQLEGDPSARPQVVRQVGVRKPPVAEQLYDPVSSADDGSGLRWQHGLFPSIQIDFRAARRFRSPRFPFPRSGCGSLP
jgi:hypothetical protein